MDMYLIRFVEEPVSVNGLNISNIGVYYRPPAIQFEANSRVDAYVKAFHRLSSEGKEVTVAHGEQEHPLGFSAQEVEEIAKAGVPLTVDFPSDGYQIEAVVKLQVMDTDKAAQS